jgi:hypothetical protein
MTNTQLFKIDLYICYFYQIYLHHLFIQDQGPDNIRLKGGAVPTEGRVEIQKHGVWGTICNSNWDMFEANVTCRSLGFDGAITAYKQFGEGTGPIWLSGLKCKGNEKNIEHCAGHTVEKTTSCSHGRDAGVVCYRKGGQSPYIYCKNKYYS